METNQYEYYAFISYKREDEKWAKWLQKKLESYGFPVSLRKDNPALPSKIRPVFRDQSELSGGNLKEEIEKGLRDSKYLIVICSPRAARSPWVSKEVQYFIDNGKENDIIPFIIGGNPNSKDPEDECFPEGLRQLTDEKEILGININEMGRDAAAIKVIARMFEIRFDSLWQRHQRIKRVKLILIFLGILALAFVGLGVGGYMSYLNKQVVAQRDRAEVQTKLAKKERNRANLERDRANEERDKAILANDNLRKANMTIIRNNNVISEQNNKLKKLIKNLWEESITFDQFRKSDERYSYIGSLRGNESGSEISYIAYHPFKPLIAFVDDWGVWLHNITTNSENLILTDNDTFHISWIDFFAFSEDGTQLILSSYRDYSQIDINSKKIYVTPHESIDENMLSKSSMNKVRSLDESSSDSIYKKVKSKIRIKDNLISINKDENIITTSLGSPQYGTYSLLYNYQYKDVLIVGENRITIYDEDKHAFSQFFNVYEYTDVDMSKTGEFLRLGKDIFSRNLMPETITICDYAKHPILDYPKNFLYKKQKESFNINDGFLSFSYIYKDREHSIKVVENYTTGTAQETISNIVFAQPDEIIVIMECGKHRIFNADTEELIGLLENYADGTHLFGMNVAARVIGRDLYTVSADGTFCIYNLDNQKMKKVVIFPESSRFESDRIDKCDISNDGKNVRYAYQNDSVFYEFKLP